MTALNKASICDIKTQGRENDERIMLICSLLKENEGEISHYQPPPPCHPLPIQPKLSFSLYVSLPHPLLIQPNLFLPCMFLWAASWLFSRLFCVLPFLSWLLAPRSKEEKMLWNAFAWWCICMVLFLISLSLQITRHTVNCFALYHDLQRSQYIWVA